MPESGMTLGYLLDILEDAVTEAGRKAPVFAIDYNTAPANAVDRLYHVHTDGRNVFLSYKEPQDA